MFTLCWDEACTHVSCVCGTVVLKSDKHSVSPIWQDMGQILLNLPLRERASTCGIEKVWPIRGQHSTAGQEVPPLKLAC